mgnify:CR=1 FL=1
MVSKFAFKCNLCHYAVGFLHSQQPPLAHRDIKPENMLLASDGLWKLCDFGSVVGLCSCWNRVDP